MTDQGDLTHLLLIIGGIVVACSFLRLLSKRIAVPAVVGYLLLGFLLRLSEGFGPWITGSTAEIFRFLADIGIIMLLFRVGLDMDIGNLLAQLRRASGIWVGDLTASSLTGFLAAWLLGLGLIPSLIVAAALTATSVGVTIAVWQDNQALDTRQGGLLLDLAELDDISGVVLLAILLAVVPTLHAGNAESVLPLIGRSVALVLGKLALFGLVCFFLSRHLEPRLRRLFEGNSADRGGMLLLAALGLAVMVAGAAGSLGFSLAIGAFFAGLVFNPDPKVRGLEESFAPLHDFFAPFFFIHMGLQIRPGALQASLVIAGGLLLAAMTGKVLGAGLPARLFLGTGGAFLLGVSMIPRAEIAMIIMSQGLRLGDWAVTPELFSAMVLVSFATCLLTPFALKPLLRRQLGAPESQPAPAS